MRRWGVSDGPSLPQIGNIFPLVDTETKQEKNEMNMNKENMFSPPVLTVLVKYLFNHIRKFIKLQKSGTKKFHGGVSHEST